MAGSDWDQENPYASPRSIDGAERGDVENDPDVFVIEPWLRFRDWIDVSLTMLDVGVWLCLFGAASAVFLLVPAFLAFLCLGPMSAAIIRGIACFLLLVLGILICILLLRFAVSRLSIDAGGIAFERRVGQPRFLRWTDIRSVRPAPRREVFLQAWLRPWPTREPTKTKSTLGHYRIEWADGYVFFPPKDPALFEKAIRKFCPRLLVHE